uniref:Uncharacterized protein n=1 Tax=Anguilla anguilla TaxID=7936 RepID=A0A0E9UZ32_ANGAN
MTELQHSFKHRLKLCSTLVVPWLSLPIDDATSFLLNLTY